MFCLKDVKETAKVDHPLQKLSQFKKKILNFRSHIVSLIVYSVNVLID